MKHILDSITILVRKFGWVASWLEVVINELEVDLIKNKFKILIESIVLNVLEIVLNWNDT